MDFCLLNMKLVSLKLYISVRYGIIWAWKSRAYIARSIGPTHTSKMYILDRKCNYLHALQRYAIHQNKNMNAKVDDIV